MDAALFSGSAGIVQRRRNEWQRPAVPPAEVTADVDYEVFGGEDMPQLFDMQAKYTDAVGKTVTADVASLPWSISVKGAKVPFEATVELVLTAKEEVAEQAAYRVGLGSGVSYTTTDGQYKEATGASTMTIGKDKVEKYRQTILGRTYKSTERIEVSGK
jgi:hypothetical protein